MVTMSCEAVDAGMRDQREESLERTLKIQNCSEYLLTYIVLKMVGGVLEFDTEKNSSSQ